MSHPSRKQPNAYDKFFSFLDSIALAVNAGHPLPEPIKLSDPTLASDPELSKHFQQLDNAVWVPYALEMYRILSQVKRRFKMEDSNQLVGRSRLDIIERIRPVRDWHKPGMTPEISTSQELSGAMLAIAQNTPSKYATFSSYQVDGWSKVTDALEGRTGLVITAPTGAGKTEVFLLPLIQHALRQKANGNLGVHFLIYPRVALIKDQLSRLLLYTHCANLGGNNLTVGLQFGGISNRNSATINNRRDNSIFSADDVFKPVAQCPVCESGSLKLDRHHLAASGDHGMVNLKCSSNTCTANFIVSISQSSHAINKPDIMVATAESLERLYMNPRQEKYLKQIESLIIDEVHIFEALQGAHIHQVVRKIDDLVGKPIAKIAVSATIGEPQRFVTHLFFGSQAQQVELHEFDKSVYVFEVNGIEAFITLQVPDEEKTAAFLLIQTVMALGHAGLKGSPAHPQTNELQVVFIDSLDSSERMRRQLNDAESTRRLWKFRTMLDELPACGRSPAHCETYLAGECWRALNAGQDCAAVGAGFRTSAMTVAKFASNAEAVLEDVDVAISTPTLEVGVDDNRIKAVVQYGPPRSTASLTQRRGRAGRSGKEVSYTIMVLADKPADHFALATRHALIDGSNDVPLNVDNSVIKSIHTVLQKEKVKLKSYFNNSEATALLKWVKDVFSRCSHVSSQFPILVTIFNRYSYLDKDKSVELKADLSNYLEEQLRVIRPILEIRTSIFALLVASPPTFLGEVKSIQDAASDVLEGRMDQASFEQIIHNALIQIVTVASPEERADAFKLLEKINDLSQALTSPQTSGNFLMYQRRYSFLSRLEKWISNDTSFFSPSDDIKAVLQALYYLHQGLSEGEREDCGNDVKYYAPNNFFSGIKPIKFSLYNDDGSPGGEIEEQINTLDQFFFPYRMIFRHGTELNTLAIVPDASSIVVTNGSEYSVKVSLSATGIHTDGYLLPQQVDIRSVRTDNNGQQLVNLCRNCLRVHHIDNRRCCGRPLTPVKFYGSPRLATEYIPASERCLSSSIKAAHGSGMTIILGSEVEALVYKWASWAQGYVAAKNQSDEQEKIEISARYIEEDRIRYGIISPAIGWDLEEVVQKIIGSEVVMRRMGTTDAAVVQIRTLKTAVSMLHRAVAALSGVRLDMFQTSFDPTTNRVWIWEVYEGGAGLTDVFGDTLRRDPFSVFINMMRSYLCPVYYAEVAFHNGKNAKKEIERVAGLFGVKSSQMELQTITEMAEAELKRIQNMNVRGEIRSQTCSVYDGCPNCVQDAYVNHEEGMAESRWLAGAIIKCFVKKLSDNDLAKEMRVNSGLRLIGGKPGENYVLRL